MPREGAGSEGVVIRYWCRAARCTRSEEYRAKDDRAEYAHLCGVCWKAEPTQRQDYYAKLAGLTPAQAMALLVVSPRGEVRFRR